MSTEKIIDSRPIIKNNIKKEPELIILVDDYTGEEIGEIEILQCGHQNNLMLDNRQASVCPKGCL